MYYSCNLIVSRSAWMRLITSQELRFQDLPNISLPYIAQAAIESHSMEILNAEKFMDEPSSTFSKISLAKLSTKISEVEILLVSQALSESITDTLVSLKDDINTEECKKGHNVEHWDVHPQLRGLAKFNAELLIQRLTFHQRVYGGCC